MSETFQDAIRAAGLEPPKHIVPGELYRFPGRDKSKTNQAGWCKLFEDLQGGVFGDFSTGLQGQWQAKRDYTAEEAAEWQRQIKEAQSEQRKADEQEKNRQKEKSLKAWEQGYVVIKHPYLRAKGVKSHGLRMDERNLLIPLQDVEGAFQGLQWIGPEGHKGFAKGSHLQGSYFLIGEPKDVLYVAEGYATGASVHESTGHAVAIAFNSSNLKAVSEGLRKKYPNAPITIAADNDQWTEGNPGLRYAQEAAEAVGGAVIYPTFTREAIARFKEQPGKRPTDFNDLYQLEGLTAVKEQINNHTNNDVIKPSELILDRYATSATSARISHNIRAIEGARPATHPLPIRYPTTANPLPGQSESENSSFGVLVEEGRKGPKLVIASKAAREITKVLKGQFAHDAESGVWHAFTGVCWAPETTPITLHRKLTHWLYAETEPVGFTPGYMDSALVLIQRAGMLSLPEPHGLIPFANGLLDTQTRALVKTTPANALTWALPYNYSPNAACPVFQDWLRGAAEDEGTVQLLRAFMAALLRSPAKYHKFLHLIGPGGTGKSTFIRLLQWLVGEQNTVSTDLRQLEQNRFESAMLYQKRLAMITESDKYGGSVNNLKAATGQDPLRLERKHAQQAGSFIFDGLVLMASNEALTTTDHSSGIERRRVTIPFEKRITEEQKRRWNECGGEEQLRAEIPGLVNWLLDMSIAEMERVISQPPARVVNANIEAMRSSNPVADWAMDNCIPASGAWIQIGVKEEVKDMGSVFFFNEKDHLYPNYLRWCLQNGREPLSVRRFSPDVIDTLKNCLGADVMKVSRKGLKGIQGLRLKGPMDPPYEWSKTTR